MSAQGLVAASPSARVLSERFSYFLLAGHLRMPSLAAGCWTYVASTTIQYVGKTQERFRGDQTEPLRSGRKYTPSKNKCRPRGTKLYASKTGTILESTACTV